jgi:hypothetical protein
MAPPALPQQIVLMEAQRDMRLHHMLWHTARNAWLRFSPAQRQPFTDLGWEPPRPAVGADRRPILDNDSGEDFLFMHRQMIEAVNAKLAQIAQPDYPEVVGWPTFPAPGDADYPVPPAYSFGDPDADADLARVKSAAFFTGTFRPQEQVFEDPQFLSTISMGELGARVEFSVHNWAHMRWSAKPAAFRPNPAANHPDAVDPAFDAPSYDFLGDFYSSHVNPIFWKLHGWVDSRIDAWKAANGVAGEYHWKGTWVGPAGGHHHHDKAVPAAVGDESRAAAERLLVVAADAGLSASPREAVEVAPAEPAGR